MRLKTPFKYGIVFQHPDSSKKVDSPTVFRKSGIWYMAYVVFDGQGYKTWWAFGSKNITKMTMNALVEMGKPIIYIGFEVGVQVQVGVEMIKRLGRAHPTTEAFYLGKRTRNTTKNTTDEGSFLTSENPAFDEIGLLVAVEGGIGEFFNTVQVRVETDEYGANSWIPDEQGNESYITLLPEVKKKLSEVITDIIRGDF